MYKFEGGGELEWNDLRNHIIKQNKSDSLHTNFLLSYLNYDRQTNRPTNQLTDEQTGSYTYNIINMCIQEYLLTPT